MSPTCWWLFLVLDFATKYRNFLPITGPYYKLKNLLCNFRNRGSQYGGAKKFMGQTVFKLPSPINFLIIRRFASNLYECSIIGKDYP